MNSAGAKRSSRGSVKMSSAIPYTSSSPFGTNVSKRKSAHQHKAVNMLSRVASAVLQTIRSSPQSSLHYGDILRDVPFHVHNRVVAFFSTHPSFFEDQFDVRHGECVRFTTGPWMNQIAIIIGIRGGILWVIGSDGPVIAHPINDVDRYQLEKTTADSALLLRFREGLEAAKRDADLDYDPEQREFLQKAPDLYAEVLDDENDITGDESVYGERWSKGENFGNNVRRSHNSVKTFFDSDIHDNNNNSNNNKILWEKKRVILVPQVVQLTGDLGWAGEGVVVVNGGGVKLFSASLSASVLL